MNKISVIVPIYNSSNTLDRLLSSLLNQNYNNLEIILVNDGSIDDSLEICKKYKDKDYRIKIINQKNRGVGVARNKGLDMATGDFISFVDSDDTIDQNYFSELILRAMETNADIVESGAKVILPHNNIIYPYDKKEKINVFDNHDYMKNYLNFSLNVSVWGKIYKRDLISDIRFPKLNINEDFIFLWEIVKKTNLFCETLNTNYHYYLDKEVSLSKAPFNADNMSMIPHIDKVLFDVKKIYPDLGKYALNHHNACLLHNLILYFNYITSNNVEQLFLEERDIMVERAKKINSIDNFLLLHESQYDLSNLISEVTRISNERCVK